MLSKRFLSLYLRQLLKIVFLDLAQIAVICHISISKNVLSIL